MKELALNNKVKKILVDFTEQLKALWGDNLVSIILYGSAASGEFSRRHSNVNILVVLNNSHLGDLTKISSCLNKHEFNNINPLFFSRDFISKSLDVFPIEFLDIKENYFILFGEDLPAGLNIDIKNLRYQCEHELRIKFINTRKFYLHNLRDSARLCSGLVSFGNSVLHVMRNLLRIKNKITPYIKEDIVKEAAKEFGLNSDVFIKILDIKKRNLKLRHSAVLELFSDFAAELEKLIEIVDRLQPIYEP